VLQAGEILSELNASNEPQLVVGDFNANPTQFPFTYAEMVSAGFTDVAAALGETGPICCQPPDLNNPVSDLPNRYELCFRAGIFFARRGTAGRKHDTIRRYAAFLTI
jgi:hypothetical protein